MPMLRLAATPRSFWVSNQGETSNAQLHLTNHCAGIIRRRIINNDDLTSGQRLRCDGADCVTDPWRGIASGIITGDRGHRQILLLKFQLRLCESIRQSLGTDYLCYPWTGEQNACGLMISASGQKCDQSKRILSIGSVRPDVSIAREFFGTLNAPYLILETVIGGRASIQRSAIRWSAWVGRPVNQPASG